MAVASALLALWLGLSAVSTLPLALSGYDMPSITESSGNYTRTALSAEAKAVNASPIYRGWSVAEPVLHLALAVAHGWLGLALLKQTRVLARLGWGIVATTAGLAILSSGLEAAYLVPHMDYSQMNLAPTPPTEVLAGGHAVIASVIRMIWPGLLALGLRALVRHTRDQQPFPEYDLTPSRREFDQAERVDTDLEPWNRD